MVASACPGARSASAARCSDGGGPSVEGIAGTGRGTGAGIDAAAG